MPDALNGSPAPGATPEGQNSPAGDGASSTARSGSTHFDFQAKIFTTPGAYFALSKATKEAMYHLDAEGMLLSVPIKTVRVEFNIPPESDDNRLLEIVEKGLRYVKEIRPGDSIPRELLDGTASWSVEDKHRNLAKNRLLIQITSHIFGDELVTIDRSMLDQMVEDAAIKERIQEAVGAFAEKLGIGRDRKQDVLDKVEFFAREMAYIEALRDHYGRVRRIFASLASLHSGVYKRDRGVAEHLQRIINYTKYPRKEFGNIFDSVDSKTSDIMGLIKSPARSVKFIRDKRDELHIKLMDWQDLIEKWEAMPLEKSVEIEMLMQATFRFLVERYLETNDWPDPNQIRGKR